MRAILANLGFILELTGILMVVPISVGFYYDEIRPLLSLFITAVAFFITGFLMNSFSIKKELDYKTSCILVTIVFFALGIIGSIPYIYSDVFSQGDIFYRFTDGFFESISGFTTTGLTLITDVESLPRTIVFYRAMTQWIGGLGIVFILLAFLYPIKDLKELTRVLGMEKITEDTRKAFINVLFIYVVYTLFFIFLLYFIFGDLFISSGLTLSAISTGGFSPVNNFSTLINLESVWLIPIILLFGATNFMIHYKIFRGKFRYLLNSELIVYFVLIALFIMGVYVLGGMDTTESYFHVISAATNTGFSFIDFTTFYSHTKLIFIVIMFIGGMTISTAGGIKILRLLLLFKSLPWLIKRFVRRQKDIRLYIDGSELAGKDILINMLIPLMSIAIIAIVTWIFTLYGFPLVNSLFEVTSAISTTGFSCGIITPELPVELKWTSSFLMILGRIEIIPFFVAISVIRINWKNVKMISNMPSGIQTYDFDCGVKAMQLVLAYYGIELREDYLIKVLESGANGTNVRKMISLSKSLGFEVLADSGFTLDKIRHYVDQNRPVIVPIQAWADKNMSPDDWEKDDNDGHYVIIVGYQPGIIIFEDPSSFRKTWLSEDEFLARWHDVDPETQDKLERFAIILLGKDPVKSSMEHMD
jgi:trk system potassium uptake protein